MKWSVRRMGRSQAAPEVRASILAFAVLVLAAGAFVRGLGADFVYDDVLLIEKNRYVHGFAHWHRWFTHDFWDVDHAWAQQSRVAYLRPLVSASYALDWSLGGGSPLGYHVSNLALHAVTSVLAFYTLERWTGRRLGAFIGALVFALHPTKAESVAWISGRPDVLVTLGLLIATAGIGRRLRGRSGGVPLECIGTLVAYASKEQALVLPVLAGVEAWAAAGRPALDWRDRGLRRTLARAVLPAAAVALLYLGLRTVLVPSHGFDLRSTVQAGFVLETYGRYLLLTLWPADLSLFQAAIRSSPSGPVVSWPHVALGAALLAGAAASVAVLRRRQPEIVVGLGTFILLLIPVSNLVFLGWSTLVSPRFLYSPLLGVGLLVAVAGGVPLPGAVRALVAAGVSAGLLVMSFVRSGDFAWSHVFWEREYRANPEVPTPALVMLERTRDLVRPFEALRIAQRAHEAARRSFSHTGEDAIFLLLSVEILAQLTPDRNDEALARISRFLRDLLAGAPEARLELAEVRLALSAQSKGAARLRQRPTELWMSIASIESRRARDSAALDAATRAVDTCPRCANALQRAATVAARAGRFELAHAWLDRVDAVEGPEATRNRRTTFRNAEEQLKLAANTSQPEAARARAGAMGYASLGAWGRGYRVAAPFEAELTAGSARGVYHFAHLAYAAGYEQKA